MMVGDTAQLTVAAVPWNAKFNASGVKWQSGNTDALTVDGNGFVTAVGEGKATITASCETQGGDTLTAQREVNVKAAPSIDVAALFCEGNGVARVQVIDPEAHSVVMTCEFDDDVRQVGVFEFRRCKICCNNQRNIIPVNIVNDVISCLCRIFLAYIVNYN